VECRVQRGYSYSLWYVLQGASDLDRTYEDIGFGLDEEQWQFSTAAVDCNKHVTKDSSDHGAIMKLDRKAKHIGAKSQKSNTSNPNQQHNITT
jgi:hypothetical protein